MDPFERSSRRHEAQRRLRAKRQRIGQIRGRVVATSLIGFVLLWCVVFAQMATGNDPILGGGRPSTARASEADGRKERRQGTSTPSPGANESTQTTDPEELGRTDTQAPPPQTAPVNPAPAPIELAPVQTAQS